MEQINTDITDSIKSYWNKYKENSKQPKWIKDDSVLNNICKEWEEYRKKIIDDTKFELSDYTNLRNDGIKTNDYLCHFLETKSKCLGSSRPGNSTQFGIYHSNENKDKTKVYKIANQKGSYDIDSELIKSTFKKIKELLNTICTGNSKEDKIKAIDFNEVVSAKQILRKLLVLEHPSEFIQIYQDKALEKIGRAHV